MSLWCRVTIATALNAYIWQYNGDGGSEVTQPLQSSWRACTHFKWPATAWRWIAVAQRKWEVEEHHSTSRTLWCNGNRDNDRALGTTTPPTIRSFFGWFLGAEGGDFQVIELLMWLRTSFNCFFVIGHEYCFECHEILGVWMRSYFKHPKILCLLWRFTTS